MYWAVRPRIVTPRAEGQRRLQGEASISGLARSLPAGAYWVIQPRKLWLQQYVDFFTLGQAVLQMLGSIHHVTISEEGHERVKQAMLTMPPHSDVVDGLTALRDNGFRLVTLTNSPPNPQGPSPLEHAGLGGFFERQFSVDTCRTYKPHPSVYRLVCEELAVPPENCMMVAAHVWDTIGAQSVGFRAALVTRAGNAPLVADGLPQPDLVVGDLRQLAEELEAR
jgi:2-haloacid dehalogenase